MEIKTVNLTKIYRLGASEIAAVNNASFTVKPSEFTAIVGRSGSGKSTLLNLIGLNDRPTSGKILIDKEDVTGFSSTFRRRIRLLRMGFVFQTFNLFSTLSAVENVELPLSLTGMSRKEQRERASELLESVGLSGRLHHRPKELSLGEMQRVAIARALANQPEMIVADEPTGELDSRTAKEIVGLLVGVNEREKATVVVATHDDRIVEMADRTYLIEDGVLCLR